MRLVLLLVLAAVPALAEAGTTIHYEGTAKAEAEVPRIVADAVAFAKASGWLHEADPGGAVLFPHPWCEPVELRFQGKALAANFVKTQFAGAEVHAAVVELLRRLEPRFEKLEVFDEGEYWESGDRARLAENLRANASAIERLRSANPGAKGPLRLASGRIVDLLTGADPSVAGESAPPAAPLVAPPGWKRFDAADAGFAVLFPGEPERGALTRDGAPVLFYAWSGPAGARLQVTTTFWDREVPPEVPSWAADQFAKAHGGRVLAKSPYLGRRHQGISLEIEREGARAATRVVAIGRRVYQLVATAEGAAPTPAEIGAFFDSFEPREAEPPPPPAPPAAARAEPVPPAARAHGWKAFVARAERFELSFPGSPVRTVQDGPIVVHAVDGAGEAPTFVVHTFTTPTAAAAAESAPGLADAVAAQFPGRVIRDEETKLAGLPARAVAVATGSMRIQYAFVASGSRIHRLAVGANGAEPHPDDVRRFFESFRPLP